MKINNNKNKLVASITVEASLVLPIFILAMYAFIFLIQVFMVQDEIQHGLLKTVRYCEKVGYVYEYLLDYEDEEEGTQEQGTSSQQEQEKSIDTENESNEFSVGAIAGNVITSALIKIKFQDIVNQSFINKSCVTSGMNGLSFALSTYDDTTKMVDVIVRYQVHLPLGCISINDFKITQRVKARVFVGTNCLPRAEEVKKDDEYVYITETGTVYHEIPNCTHIKLSIHKIAGRSITSKRNNGGGKYQPCELCKPTQELQGTSASEYFYITSSGDKYHCSLNCSGLKRSVKKIKRSEVGDRHACSRCGKVSSE